MLKVRVADVSAVTEDDIAIGPNEVDTPYGTSTITSPCGYALLEPLGDTKAIASLGGETVAVQTADGRFTWFGLSLSAGFADVGDPGIVLGVVKDADIQAPVAVEGDGVVPVVTRSRLGGWLVFVFNLGRREAVATLRPRWQTRRAVDLLTGAEMPVADNAIAVEVEPWGVGVVHCAES